jgi:hypothetical protein
LISAVCGAPQAGPQQKKARKAAEHQAEAERASEEATARRAAEEAKRAEAALTLTLTPEESRLVEADRLRQDLEAGGDLPVLDPKGVVLGEGETVVARVPAQLVEFRGEAVEYRQEGGLFFGNPLFVVGALAASVAVSAAARSHARQAARTQWRSVDAGDLILTNQRLCLMGSLGWHEIPFPSLRFVECEVDALAVHPVNGPPLRIALESPEVVFILLNYLAWKRLPETHLPQHLVERMQRAEIIIATGPAGDQRLLLGNSFFGVRTTASPEAHSERFVTIYRQWMGVGAEEAERALSKQADKEAYVKALHIYRRFPHAEAKTPEQIQAKHSVHLDAEASRLSLTDPTPSSAQRTERRKQAQKKTYAKDLRDYYRKYPHAEATTREQIRAKHLAQEDESRGTGGESVSTSREASASSQKSSSDAAASETPAAKLPASSAKPQNFKVRITALPEADSERFVTIYRRECQTGDDRRRPRPPREVRETGDHDASPEDDGEEGADHAAICSSLARRCSRPPAATVDLGRLEAVEGSRASIERVSG